MTTTPTTDDSLEESDPIIDAIAKALEDNADKWVSKTDGDVHIALEVAAAIMLEVVGEGYCNGECHLDEFHSVLESIRECETMTTRDEILAMLEVSDDASRP